MRLLICAGGTGGGVYPALAVQNALVTAMPGTETLWVGSVGGMEADLVQRAGIPFRAIPAAGLHGVGLRRLPRNVSRLARGLAASAGILREFRPDVLLFTGGYLAAPMAVAGWRYPSLLFVPDIEPGLALRFIARTADRIAITAGDTGQYLPRRARTVSTGYPVRRDFARWDRVGGRKHLGLQVNTPTLLVAGGSLGANSLNAAVSRNLEELLAMAQVVHLTGNAAQPVMADMARRLAPAARSRYHPLAYLHEMGAALAAADLVVSRAGASTLGEYPYFGLPSVLVPYPHAWRYQKVNADYLARHEAAVIINDSRLEAELPGVVRDLLTNPRKLEAMGAAARKLASPHAAEDIAGQLIDLAG